MSKCKFKIGDKAYYYEFYLDDATLVETGIDVFVVKTIEKKQDTYYIGTDADEHGHKEIFLNQNNCYKTLDGCKLAIINILKKELELVKNFELEED